MHTIGRRTPTEQSPEGALQATEISAAILPPGCIVPGGRPQSIHPLLVEPDVEHGGVEANEAPDLEVRNAAFGHKSLDVAPGDTEGLATASVSKSGDSRVDVIVTAGFDRRPFLVPISDGHL